MVENEHVKMTDEQYARNISKLKKLLADQPLSDLQVSRNCGLSEGALNFIKNGHNYGSDLTWEAMGKYFGVKFEYEVIKPYKKIVRKKKKENIITKDTIITLKKEGNVFIGRKKVDKFGVSTILDAMKDYGIECIARIPETDGKGIILEICG